MTPQFEQAIARQFATYREARRAGMPRAGWKICVNDPVAQHHLGLDEPFVGCLRGDRRVGTDRSYPVGAGCRPAVEAEIALRIGATLPTAVTTAQARAAIAGVAPSLEVVDYALASRDLTRIAETASFHHGFVLGAERELAHAPKVRRDCPRLRVNGSPTAEADPRLVPDDLGEIVALVARFLARFDERLEAGDWILSGSCVRPAFVASGDVVEADFGPLGVVRTIFVHD